MTWRNRGEVSGSYVWQLHNSSVELRKFKKYTITQRAIPKPPVTSSCGEKAYNRFIQFGRIEPEPCIQCSVYSCQYQYIINYKETDQQSASCEKSAQRQTYIQIIIQANAFRRYWRGSVVKKRGHRALRDHTIPTEGSHERPIDGAALRQAFHGVRTRWTQRF